MIYKPFLIKHKREVTIFLLSIEVYCFEFVNLNSYQVFKQQIVPKIYNASFFNYNKPAISKGWKKEVMVRHSNNASFFKINSQGVCTTIATRSAAGTVPADFWTRKYERSVTMTSRAWISGFAGRARFEKNQYSKYASIDKMCLRACPLVSYAIFVSKWCLM